MLADKPEQWPLFPFGSNPQLVQVVGRGRWAPPGGTFSCPGYTRAGGKLRPAGPMRCYVPRPAELAALEAAGLVAPGGRPRWEQVQAELVARGHTQADLAALSAPAVVALLQRTAAGAAADDRGAELLAAWRKMNLRVQRVIAMLAKDGESGRPWTSEELADWMKVDPSVLRKLLSAAVGDGWLASSKRGYCLTEDGQRLAATSGSSNASAATRRA